MEIRPADPTDLDFAAAIMRRTQAAHVEAMPHRYRPLTEAEARAILAERLDSDATIVVATDDDGTRLGYAISERVDEPGSPMLRPRRFCYLRDIGVARAARRRGVARALIDHVRAAAERAGADSVELDVWAFNASARQCFEAAGFEPVGTRMRAVQRVPGDAR